MDLTHIDIEEIGREARTRAKALNESGVTHEELALATGLPASSISMLLRGYRPIIKVSTLSGLVKGVVALERDRAAA